MMAYLDTGGTIFLNSAYHPLDAGKKILVTVVAFMHFTSPKIP